MDRAHEGRLLSSEQPALRIIYVAITSMIAGCRMAASPDLQLLLGFLIHNLEVELPGRLLVEQRALFRISAAHVHGTGRNGEIGAGTNSPLVAVLGLVNVGAP